MISKEKARNIRNKNQTWLGGGYPEEEYRPSSLDPNQWVSTENYLLIKALNDILKELREIKEHIRGRAH